MVSFLIRLVKRFAVLLPGIVITYFSIRDIFPSLNEWLPVGWAVFATYILGAYVLIPAVIRLARIIFPPKHAPTYSVTPDGFASDPINIGLVGSRETIIAALRAAGWTVADRHTPATLIRAGLALFLQRDYKAAPMSHLYLFGRKQDIAFEIQTNNGRGQRHHVRFWATEFNPAYPLSGQSVSRQKIKPPTDHEVLWLGAASQDIGFALIRHSAQVSHMIHPNTDRERDLIVSTLSKASQVKTVDTVRLAEPYRLSNRVWRGYLESDGVMAICHLRG